MKDVKGAFGKFQNGYMTSIILLWLKTYVVLRFLFELSVESLLEEVILFISPLSFSILLFTLVRSDKFIKNIIYKALANLLATGVLYANLLYYRFFNDFITLPVVFQTNNFSDLGGSTATLANPFDVFLFVDIIVLTIVSIVSAARKREPKAEVPFKHRSRRFGILIALSIFVVNVGLAYIERPELLTRTFDREMLMKYLGPYNYQMYDVVLQSNTKVKRAFAESSELAPIRSYTEETPHGINAKMFGKAKGKNLILISLESTQSFVINNKVNGKEITPFLNDLIDKSYYFPNFYQQTGQGKTSDSEFLVENSLYGLPSGAVFFTNSQNEYNATPEILGKSGYESAVFHANNKSFWNRNIMYQTLGYDRYFSQEDFNITPEKSIGWGLKDEYLYKQSMKYLDNLKEPFYAKYITLTNHFPFSLEEEDEIVSEWDSNDGVFNRYFTTVSYEDNALKQYFNRLKEKGLYKDSLFVIYGDHNGISDNHTEAMEKYLGKPHTPYRHIQLQRVPLIIHNPGQKGKVMETVSGQIDLKPTILHLLGKHIENDIQFGTDLFAKERKDFTVLRDGSFITDKYIYTEGKCYRKPKGNEVDSKQCQEWKPIAEEELNKSDQVVYGDLLRFLQPYSSNDNVDG
ncbi:LTA synthase family protein [Halobacillus amylolyticus]|uniref:LTA synthase family protein n=1 Tax=Halobacillus amylolyticus TaxID=2932259 RepID=A0ABY4HJN7_9BACI|nr:LTA synthase family protein [Halobacillus amylolyticus]UOR14130.1 LTA synthase family protein [Halobacillus amylolyticus]